MNAHPKFIATTAHVDDAAVHPLPRSSKVYVEGSRPDVRVPMRRIEQTDTPASFGAEKNPPVYVYDTSGPYTDPDARIDIRSGLPRPARKVDRRARRHGGRWTAPPRAMGRNASPTRSSRSCASS